MENGSLHAMKLESIILVLALTVCSCTTTSTARLKAQNAFIAGQNAVLQQQAQSAFPKVSVIGPVENSLVPWVAGLTLAQAIATANYLGTSEPKEIILTRQGESAKLSPQILLNGAVVPLEAGDVVEIR
jgi:hypothetical protein